jgi:hypothetical protein
MTPRRTLSLKREVLQELADSDLTAIVGAAEQTPTAQQTEKSCLDYISCWWWQCATRTVLCRD